MAKREWDAFDQEAEREGRSINKSRGYRCVTTKTVKGSRSCQQTEEEKKNDKKNRKGQ